MKYWNKWGSLTSIFYVIFSKIINHIETSKLRQKPSITDLFCFFVQLRCLVLHGLCRVWYVTIACLHLNYCKRYIHLKNLQRQIGLPRLGVAL